MDPSENGAGDGGGSKASSSSDDGYSEFSSAAEESDEDFSQGQDGFRIAKPQKKGEFSGGHTGTRGQATPGDGDGDPMIVGLGGFGNNFVNNFDGYDASLLNDIYKRGAAIGKGKTTFDDEKGALESALRKNGVNLNSVEDKVAAYEAILQQARDGGKMGNE